MSFYRRHTPYVYLLPNVLLYVGFILVPLAWGFYISLNRWSIYKGNEGFVGLKYYLRLFDSDFERGRQFWNGLWVTLQFVVYFTPLLVLLGLGLALLLHSCRSGLVRKLTQTSIMIPTAIAVSVSAVVWRWIFGYENGLINYAASAVGLDRIPWLVDLPWVWVPLVSTTLWMAVGWNMVLFLVGLQNIPPQQYEAAAVDGAGSWSRFRHVTLPGLRPMFTFVITTQIIGAFSLFAQPQLMTRGGPGRATTSVMMFIYEEAFNPNYPRMGSAIAMGFVTGLIIFMLVSAVVFLLNRTKEPGRR